MPRPEPWEIGYVAAGGRLADAGGDLPPLVVEAA